MQSLFITGSNRLTSSHYVFLIVVFAIGLLTLYGTNYTEVSLITAIVEYLIVVYLLFTGDYTKSFIYFLAFYATTLDSDFFVYGEMNSDQIRYSFMNIPFFKGYLRWVLALIYVTKAYSGFSLNGNKLSTSVERLMKWLVFLFATGTINVIICILLNDNNIMNYPDVYPKQALIFIIGFIVKASIILTVAFLSYQRFWIQNCSAYLQLMLIDIALISGVSAFWGSVGHYGDSIILLSPIAIALTPALILFANQRQKKSYSSLSLFSAIFVIIVSFIYGGTVVGSKWYMIIGATIICLVIMTTNMKSVWKISLLLLSCLLLLPSVIEPITVLFSDNEYISFKISQALSAMNVFGDKGVKNWYDDLNSSPLQRIDELHNIFIEYMHKPYYALFGKGLGGTTLHYTSILPWNERGHFSMDQVHMGAFYYMHESLSVLFLQHGFAGIVFFLYMLIEMAKRLYKTPWAAVSLIWFVFYWDYGTSAIIGSVAMVLALLEDGARKHVTIKKRNV